MHHSVALVAALAGSALAAPYVHLDQVRSPIKREKNTNEFTPAKPGHKVVMTPENTEKVPYHTDKSYKKAPTRDGEGVPLTLFNNLSDKNVHVYIKAQELDGGKLFFVGADGSKIYPTSGGSTTPVPIEDPIGLEIGGMGESIDVTVPGQFESGRVYFVEGELTFNMVAGADGTDTVVDPSNNEGDEAAGKNWSFSELTYNDKNELWANLSYVDFVGLIMSMTVDENDSDGQEVIGLPADGVQKVCDGLKSQGDADGKPWASLCITGEDGNLLRSLAPIHFGEVGGGMDDYWTQYIDDAWSSYSNNQTLTVHTQGDVGDVSCRVVGDQWECDGGSERQYGKPTADDVWGCASGPFSNDAETDADEAIIPRLCAAIHRTTLTIKGGNEQPGVPADQYYTMDPSNHYCRIVHENEVDGRGYAFPYDDVSPDGNEDAAGLIRSSSFSKVTYWIGGKGDN